MGIVLERKLAPCEQRDAHRQKVIASNNAKIGVTPIVGIVRGMLHDGEESVVRLAGHGQFGDEAGGFDSRDRLDSVLQTPEECYLPRFLLVGGHHERDLRREDVRSIEARVDMDQSPEAIKEQARSDKDYEGERHFSDNERVVSQVFSARGACGAAFFQALRQMPAARLHWRHETKNNSADERDGSRE